MGRARLAHVLPHEHALEELPCAAAGAPIDVAGETLLELEAGSLDDRRVEIKRVVDDDHDRGSVCELASRVREHCDHRVAVARLRRARAAGFRGANLVDAAVREAEQLVGVAVLLVVVDQPRVRG